MASSTLKGLVANIWQAWLPIMASTVKNGIACLRKGNRRRQQCSPMQIIEPLTGKTWERYILLEGAKILKTKLIFSFNSLKLVF